MNRITLTPSEASPNETLYVDIPKLADNIFIVPESVYLTFVLNVTGHANNTLVNNVGRNLVKRQRVLFGGEVLQDTLDYDLFQTYHDLHLSKEARDDMLRYGVSSENTRKLRTDAGDKDDSTDAKEVEIAALLDKKTLYSTWSSNFTESWSVLPKRFISSTEIRDYARSCI